MSYEKCSSLSVNVKKEEISITSYCNNVFPATPSKWSVSGDNFRDKIKNLIDMYMSGDLHLLPSNNTNTAFALRLTRDYIEVLTGEKARFGDYSFYDMVKSFDNSLDSASFSIILSRIFNECLQGENSREKHENLKSLNAYKNYVESFKKYYNFYNNLIVDSLIDFFLKVLKKNYNKVFDEKRFRTYVEYDGCVYTEVRVKPTKYGHKFIRDTEYKDLKGAYYPNIEAYGFTTKIQTKSCNVLENLEILQMISGISNDEKEKYQENYASLVKTLENSADNMLEELKENQMELV